MHRNVVLALVLSLAFAAAASAQQPILDTIRDLIGSGNTETLIEEMDDSGVMDTEPCACTQTGRSGPADTGFIGCKQHYLQQGDERYFCYIADTRSCPEAAFSERFPGATYIFCDPPPPPATVLDVVEQTPELSILGAAIDAAGLGDALSAADVDLTLFAPTNEAFLRVAEALGIQEVESLLDPANIDLVTSILLYHVSPEAFSSAEFLSGYGTSSVPTLSDASFNSLRVVAEELNRAQAYYNWLTESDLFPQKYLKIAIENSVFSTHGSFGAHVKRSDIQTENGVVHLIDHVLKPPSDIATIATQIPRLSTFVEALQAADLVDAFECDAGDCALKPLTVFAPTNAAFATLLEELDVSAEDLFASTDLLTDVLLYHVSDPEKVGEPVLVQDVAAGAVIPNLGGGELVGDVESISDDIQTEYGGNIVISTRAVPTINGGVNGANIVAAANVPAFNGVIHLIDNVIIPPDVLAATNATLLDEPLANNETAAELSLFDAISEIEELSILAQALSIPATDSLRAALEEVTPDFSATIFAPTNDAFISLATDLGLEPADLLTEAILETILYHGTLGRVPSGAFSETGSAIMSILGLPIQAQVVDGKVVLNGDATVLDADIETLNGIIHIIDSVLMPMDFDASGLTLEGPEMEGPDAEGP